MKQKTTHRIEENICKFYMIRDLCLEIYKEFYNSIKKETTKFKNGERILIDSPPRKTSTQPINTWKDTQYHYSSGKWKLKPWDYTSYPLGFLEILEAKSQVKTCIGKDMEQMEPSYTHWW